MGIESVARLYRLPNKAAPLKVNAPSSQPEPVRLTAGHGGGSPRLFNSHYNETRTFYQDKQPTEVVEEDD